MSPPDCGDNSCLYAPSKGGMRTNGGCRCDNCPVCGGAVRPERPVTHFGWCTQQKWIPDHHRPTPRAAPCAPPTHHAFDIDIYDCPCGHMYGDHDYQWTGGNDHGNVMDIAKCNKCSHELTPLMRMLPTQRRG
jgi:hypothetical protein